MVNPNNKYQLFKFVVRFNGVDENFYEEVKDAIMMNRIFISCAATSMLFLTILIFKKTEKINAKNGIS